MNRINRNIIMTINDDNLSSKSYLPDDQQTWMRKFNLKCLAISEKKCSQKLDSLMQLYIRKMKREMNNYGPFTASNVVHHMNKTMLIFYLFYQDINDFIEISQWTRNMVEIISLYCQLELRAAQRRRPRKEADLLACRRIMAVLWSYVKNDQECMIHVLLKIPNMELKHKYILDPIYRKLLLNQKRNNLTDFEYIRNVLAFKLWKRLHYAEEKKVISEMALCELSPPKTLSKNYRNYKFLPQNINLGDIHNVLITVKLDIQMVIKGYFDHLENPRPVVIEVIDLTSEEIQTVSNNAQPLSGDLHNSSKTVCASNIDQMNDDFLLLEEIELIEIDPKEPTDIVENIETPGWCASLVERLKKTKFLEPVNNEVSEPKENPQDVEVSVRNEASEVNEVSKVTKVSKVNNISTQNEMQDEASEVNEVSKVDKVSKVNDVSTQNEIQNKENQGTQTNKDNFAQMVEKMTTAEIAPEKEMIKNCAFASENAIRLPQIIDIGTDAQPILEQQNTNIRRAISDSESNISDKDVQLSEDNTPPVVIEVIDFVSMPKPEIALPIMTAPLSPVMQDCVDQGSTSFMAGALGLTENDYILGFERSQNAKKIVEKHEYLKDEEKSPRVRIFKVREDASQAEEDEEDQPQQRTRKRHASRSAKPPLKRGTMNSDFNTNLTVSPAQSLLLNTSFQHHFCSDTATCRKSKCYPEQKQLQLDFSAASTSQEPVHFLPSISTIHHLTSPPLTAIEPQNLSVSVMGFNPPIMTAVTPLAPPLFSRTVQNLSHASLVLKPEMAPQILPTDAPYWHETKASKPKVCDHSQTNFPNVLVNINVASCNSTDDEIHLPIKKRRVSSTNASMSSLKVEIEDKLSYPATPMLSIAELITYEREMGRPFRTLAELKEFPTISDPYSNPIIPDPLQSNESGSFQNLQGSQNPQITYTTIEERRFLQIAARIAAWKSKHK